MEKAVGQVITIVRTNPATGVETREQARVLAANGGIYLYPLAERTTIANAQQKP